MAIFFSKIEGVLPGNGYFTVEKLLQTRVGSPDWSNASGHRMFSPENTLALNRPRNIRR